MVDYQVIEPKPLHRLQMNHTSKLYEVYVDLLKKHNRKKANELAMQYCLAHPPLHLEDQIACLEFLCMNEFFEELGEMVEKDIFDEEVTLLYRILLNRMDTMSADHPLLLLESLEFSHPSLQCLHKFVIVYRYYDVKKYTVMDKYIEQCDLALQSINEPLAHYYLQLRYNELLFHHYWRTDNALLARRYAYKIINTELSPRKTCMMYHHLALTHVFENYQSSMDQANLALSLAKENGITRQIKALEERTIPFIAAFHRQVHDISTPDRVETAHLALAKGDHELAAYILNSLPSLTPFQQCYLGLATKNRVMIIQSKERFIQENGDQFFAKLAEYYLERL